jgi:hypothetical protein
MSHLVQKKCDYGRYQFAICESCYWTATVFDTSEKQDLPCPICHNDQIALIPLSMDEQYIYAVKPDRGLDIEFMIRNAKRNDILS